MLLSDPGIAAHKRQTLERQRAIIIGLALSLALAALSVNREMPLPTLATALLAAAIYLIYEGLDPLKAGFLHHDRIRLVGAALTFGGAALLATLTNSTAVAPLACACLIGFRHHRSAVSLDLAAARELTALKQKILALECRDRQARQTAPGDSLGDNRRKAS